MRDAPQSWSAKRIAVFVAVCLFTGACGSVDSSQGFATSRAAETTEASPERVVSTDASLAAARAAADAFVADPSTAAARAFVTSVAADRSELWTPWLIDLLRMQISTLLSAQIGDLLEQISGIESTSRIPDLLAYGSWSQNRGHTGGDGYRQFKMAIYQTFDPEFGPFLESIQDNAELAAIQWGGVSRGGIPELNSQPRVPAADADWMIDDQVVMGVVINGEAAAYPLAVMQRHELANDVVGGEPVAIVYCTLCRSGLVYRSKVADQVLNFQTSGLLLNSNKIMVDRETETLWHHLRGLGIGGELLGAELELLPVNHMRWADWVAENPDTTVPTLPEPIYFEDPERPGIAYDYTPGEAYRSYYESDDLWFQTTTVADTFDPKTEVVGIEHQGESLAFDVEAFNDLGMTRTIELGGATLTVVPTGAGVRVFDANGERIISEQSFWFAWFANHPETRTLEPSGP